MVLLSIELTNALSYFAPNPPNVKRHAYKRNMSIVVLASFPTPYEIGRLFAHFLRPKNALKVPFFGQKDAVFIVRRSVLQGRKKPSRFIEKRSRFFEERSSHDEEPSTTLFRPSDFLVCTFSEYLFLTNFIYIVTSPFSLFFDKKKAICVFWKVFFVFFFGTFKSFSYLCNRNRRKAKKQCQKEE